MNLLILCNLSATFIYENLKKIFILVLKFFKKLSFLGKINIKSNMILLILLNVFIVYFCDFTNGLEENNYITFGGLRL